MRIIPLSRPPVSDAVFPVKRTGFIAIPLLSRALGRADEIVYAMEARCYSEQRTRAVFKVNKIDWLILILCLAVLVFVLLV